MELGVKNIWEFIKEIPELSKYFLDFEEGDYPDRAFMDGVLGALRGDAWKELINKARQAWSFSSEENKDDLSWVELLNLCPIEINKYYTINGRRLVAQHLRIMGTWVGGNLCTQEYITTKDICYLILIRVLQQ